MKARRVLFLGLFGSGNQGNDASLAAGLAFVRRIDPALPIACICPAPGKIAERFGVTGVRFGAGSPRTFIGRWLNRLLFDAPRRIVGFARAFFVIRRDDVLMMPGTGVLDDFGTGPLGVPLALFAWCLAARLKGARVAFVSVGAGPARHPVSRRLLLWAARLAHHRSFRDVGSRNFAGRGGVDVSHDAIFPDIAFALPRPAARARKRVGTVIGLGVMGYYGWGVADAGAREKHDAYLAKLADFAGRLLDRGWAVRLFKGDDGDEDSIAELTARVLEARPRGAACDLHYVDAPDLPRLMARMTEVDLVVASRFHNLVAALMAGRPAVSIGYAAKNCTLLAEFGLSDFCQDIDAIDVGRLVEMVDALLAETGARRPLIEARAAAFAEALRRQEIILADALGIAPSGRPSNVVALEPRQAREGRT